MGLYLWAELKLLKLFFFFGGEQTNQVLFLLFRVTEKTVCSGKLHFLAV